MTSDVLVFSVYRTYISQYKMISSREGVLSKSGAFELNAYGFEGWCVAGNRFRD